MTGIVAGVCLLLQASALEGGVAMTGLELALDLDYRQGRVSGWASYHITNPSDVDVAQVPFNLGRLMGVRAAAGQGGGALEFSQRIAVFEDVPRLQVNHVLVRLDRPLAPGETVTLRLQYDGVLVGYQETGSLYIRDRVEQAFTILREDAFAWPVPGTLSMRTNRMSPRPDFRFVARISVPDGLTVASGGRLVDQSTVEGRTTFEYRSTAPVPFLNLPVAPYAVLRQGGLVVYHFPEDSAGAGTVLRAAASGLALLEDWFGPLAAEPELAIMEIPEGWGSQASLTGGIIQTADAFRDPGRMVALYHELSHLWNAPDQDQPSARWNEGLATFLALRMAERLDGRDSMKTAIGRVAARVLQAAERSSAIDSVPFRRYGEQSLTDWSYRVGALMFHALYQAMGAERFDLAVGGYYQDHLESGGTFEGLIGYLRRESPVDLDSFIESWVYSTRWLDGLRAGQPLERIGFTGRPLP